MLSTVNEVFSSGLSWQSVGIIVGVMMVIGGSLIRFAFVISKQMVTVVMRLNSIEKVYTDCLRHHEEFYRRLNGHDIALVEHDQRISTIEGRG